MQEPSSNVDKSLSEFHDVALRVQSIQNKETPDKSTNNSESVDSGTSRYDRQMHTEFFSSREPILYQAIEDSKLALLQENDGAYLGWWLLTLVDHWDNEKERLVLLFTHTLYVVKYDFIGLRVLHSFRLTIDKITQIQIGPLVYPDKSISPKVKDLASRVSELVKGYMRTPEDPVADADLLDRDGIKLSWGILNSWGVNQLWNPWSSDIPWLLFVSHPLICGAVKDYYNVQHFIETLRNTLHSQNRAMLEYKPIEVETYVGIPALVHNYTQLGFFKVRGRISF